MVEIATPNLQVLVLKSEIKQCIGRGRWAATFDPLYDSSSVKLEPRAVSKWQKANRGY